MTLLAILLIGFAAGFVDATVASGGLISIPLLIFLGFSAPLAIATDRFGSIGVSIGALVRFWKSGKIRWRYVPIFSLCAVVGAFFGAKILFAVDIKSLEKIIGVLLLLSLPIIFLKPHLGVKKIVPSRIKQVLGTLFYLVIMVYNGFLGTGASPLAIYNSMYFFGFTIIESNATAYVPWFILSVVSLVIFAVHGIVVNVMHAATLFVGMAAGGFLGAHSLLKIGDVWVKRLFIIVVVISAVKLLFF